MVETGPADRRTNHTRRLMGAIILFIPIPVLFALQPVEPPPPAPPAVAFPVPVPAPAVLPPSEAGPVTCGQCNGDGRIDGYDRLRRVPATSAARGDCPYCGPGRAVGNPVSRPH